MNIDELRYDLSKRSKNGIGFLMSAVVIWTIITIIFVIDLEINTQNIFMFITTGIMFPLALLFSNLINAEWKQDDSPLSILGLILNVAQFIYFPLVFWAFLYKPTTMLMVFAIITAAHLFPYGWFYNAKPYYFIAPVLSVLILMLNSLDFPLWSLSTTMIIGLILLISLLFINYKKRVERHT
ncbi:DUF7010 family protein [Piscibacillus halophilus]|uniref:Uncharacterized protein n=1 Tax=Piscibacillus halophilus TaxID=571933 RepID=A0A1H9DQ43_9BACI|nr:hypothetical protein [Piscibacillus halophilus]SEQ15636.1 hypothetical protein SAMN05216362_10783 [Piscibacillus halophilus]